MIRTLVLVAVTGFVLSIGCIAAAISIAGGPFAIRDWAMVHSDSDWTWNGHHYGHGHRLRGTLRLDGDEDGGTDAARHATRDFTWSGGDRLDVEAPADIVYAQGPVAKLTIAGPAGMVEHVQVRDGRILVEPEYRSDGRLKILLTAPGVRRFDLSGSQNLVVEDYRQDRLDLDISGAAHVSAKGEAKAVRLDIAGSGDADLAELAVDDAQIDISGSGRAKIGPKASARIDVSGDGEVELTTKPVKLATEISGSGRVSQPGAPD
ncbi:MAG TPA: DUF2807 domain-containing protein [Phenylobacterium sp.]|nr:DUF2807 domain-containing protein [Phenylobacterium sp.]